jgi:hypothetical protein
MGDGPVGGASLGGVGGEAGTQGARCMARLMAGSVIALGLMVMPLPCTGRNTGPVLSPAPATDKCRTGRSPRGACRRSRPRALSICVGSLPYKGSAPQLWVGTTTCRRARYSRHHRRSPSPSTAGASDADAAPVDDRFRRITSPVAGSPPACWSPVVEAAC